MSKLYDVKRDYCFLTNVKQLAEYMVNEGKEVYWTENETLSDQEILFYKKLNKNIYIIWFTEEQCIELVPIYKQLVLEGITCEIASQHSFVLCDNDDPNHGIPTTPEGFLTVYKIGVGRMIEDWISNELAWKKNLADTKAKTTSRGGEAYSISSNQAYEIFKRLNPEVKYTELCIEMDDSWAFVTDELFLIHKYKGCTMREGFERFFLMHLDHAEVGINTYNFMIDDFYTTLEADETELNLVKHYVDAWNTMIWIKECDESYFARYSNREQLVELWAKIEKELYRRLEKVLEQENIAYPPCCINKMNDFYKLKPIMVRNGYTDDMQGKHWVKINKKE